MHSTGRFSETINALHGFVFRRRPICGEIELEYDDYTYDNLLQQASLGQKVYCRCCGRLAIDCFNADIRSDTYIPGYILCRTARLSHMRHRKIQSED